jgi:hypothetical protein
MDYVHDYISSKPFYEKNIDVLFPNKLGKFELKNVLDIEKQSSGSGVLLEYTCCESNVTIYVYNYTIKPIKNGIVYDIIHDEMDKSIDDIYQKEISGQYNNVNICQPKNITYDVRNKKLTFSCTIANYLSKSEEMTSMIMLCAYKNHIIKTLYTTKKALFIYTSEGEKLFDGFMGNICNILCG